MFYFCSYFSVQSLPECRVSGQIWPVQQKGNRMALMCTQVRYNTLQELIDRLKYFCAEKCQRHDHDGVAEPLEDLSTDVMHAWNKTSHTYAVIKIFLNL